MEGERLGRVVAVTLLAVLTPVACAALGVGTPSASGLPSSLGCASPAVQPNDGVEAATGARTDEQIQIVTVRRTGLWAAPVRQPAQHARARVRVFVSPAKAVVNDLVRPAYTEPVADIAWVESTRSGLATASALGPVTPRPG